MIEHELIQKESIAHSILSSVSHPNILIPVKVVVKNIKYHQENPKYLVKIIKFYENISFLKDSFMNMSFINGFDKRAKPFIFNRDKIKTIDEFELIISEGEERYYIVVDSIMTWKYKNDMQKMFNKLQYYLIIRNLRDLRDNSTRSFYTGNLKIETKNEFNVRLKNMIGDKLFKTEKDYKDFIRYL